ncbi:cytochrome b [Agrobacterium tumefaciens]|uniref:cytochrome b n=1 Tax=Agrobacterium tumefaciens TaxID=358 RepID=UPI00287E920C|nr:cytochrome b [Agrobacterium tumefaciens]MDS7595013.1 cytochrome b [Agrobacterium tumefaciens]
MAKAFKKAYGPFSIILHWIIAVLICCLLALGYAMTRPDIDPALQFSLFQWHKSFGMLVLALTIIRGLHRVLSPPVAPVAELGTTERFASAVVHRCLLVLAIAVPFAGWAIASVSPLAIPTFLFNLYVVPDLPLTRSDMAETLWSNVHATLAYMLLGLVLLHAAAAIYHHMWKRDAVLLRMLGRKRPPSSEERP